jgi:hypothetical protein
VRGSKKAQNGREVVCEAGWSAVRSDAHEVLYRVASPWAAVANEVEWGADSEDIFKKMQHDTTRSWELLSKGSEVSAKYTRRGEVARQFTVSLSAGDNTRRISRSNTKSGVVGRWECGEECH